MKVIVYIYIISIVLLLMYTGFVYFITEKYQPRVSHDSDGSKLNHSHRETYDLNLKKLYDIILSLDMKKFLQKLI